ncbi:hypothetical protein EFE36_15365 [Lactiplantibacillus pentosus]|nr:hypothetical protein [Lactiplantibacillus pentosus]MCT3306012.1 hypothetical protein [Lactiplantibacillus pentosus]
MYSNLSAYRGNWIYSKQMMTNSKLSNRYILVIFTAKKLVQQILNRKSRKNSPKRFIIIMINMAKHIEEDM